MSLSRFRTDRANPDYAYISLVIVLVLFGLVMISSSSVVLSVENFGQNYNYVIKQALSLIIGIAALLVTSKIHYHAWRRLAPTLMVGSVILLLLVFIPALGKNANGASRWINIGSFQLQPSELLKLTFIIYLSAWMEKKGSYLKSVTQGLIPFLALLVVPGILLLFQRDMGTLSVIVFTAGTLFVVAGASLLQVGLGAVAGFISFLLLIVVEPYRLQRLTVFLNPSNDILGNGYHINQSLLAIGSGGVWGRGFGQSLQKYLYLPEPHTDSIFAIIVEELGFLRALIVLIVIGFFAYKGYQIANQAGDTFGRYLAFGITTWILIQSLMNIGSILGLMPLTGLPLPFISYGGTSLIVSLAAVGVVINISKYSYGR